METQNRYRLERWIALLLGLLFFLPFVANADALLVTEEMNRAKLVAKNTYELGGRRFKLHIRCGEHADPEGFFQCSLVLASDGVEQELAKLEAWPTGADERPQPEPDVLFIGELDGDGRLDLLVNTTTFEDEWYPALFLSTAAGDDEHVARVTDVNTITDGR